MSRILWPVVNRCYCRGDMSDCCCDKATRALMAWKVSEPTMPAMTENQRRYCLDEIRLSELYSVGDYETASDAKLAAAVLNLLIA